ncbi:CGNR zinc finger domain-containing protein [Amycolatopsis sp. SID8362]|uniref:CGNR zinc finger domain-containing protein n=1 Tax=Amycolatopsis sp. SID8362 TaxID=2690346 RepID=UPI00136BE3D4|nr:CGNR zinc finger domain-containing protein [Amycolatopsis sp. SID8362]NBH07466.1 CGNR zinc finger domain-containing protein [Amycolatopsis sp. SID8362]NED44162.1 CGNR zinc finger domain-containing protein [Amycolatopsis sp. SID8362]
MEFDSHYSGPVRVAVLLVNALTSGEERGRRLVVPVDDDLREAATTALRAAGESTEDLPLLTDTEAEAMVQVAEELAPIFAAAAEADHDGAAERANRLLEHYATQPRLVRHLGQDFWHLHFAGTRDGVAGEWAGACAAALAVVLGSAARDRLGICTAPRCDRAYVDTSHNGSRRFCSTACQNRVKTAAFRARNRN